MSRTLLHVSPRIMSPLGIMTGSQVLVCLFMAMSVESWVTDDAKMPLNVFGECQKTLSAQSHCCPLGDTLDHCCLLKTGSLLSVDLLFLLWGTESPRTACRSCPIAVCLPQKRTEDVWRERDDRAGTVYHAWGTGCLPAMCTTWYPVLRHKELCHSSLQSVCTVSAGWNREGEIKCLTLQNIGMKTGNRSYYWKGWWGERDLISPCAI